MRIIDPLSKIKYYSPPTDHKNPYVIETGNCKKIIICEGTFDAIACSILYPEYTPFAVLGSDITPYQLGLLRTYVPEEIKIYMDQTWISEKIQRSVSSVVNYSEFSIVESDGTDPEEFLKLQVVDEILRDEITRSKTLQV